MSTDAVWSPLSDSFLAETQISFSYNNNEVIISHSYTIPLTTPVGTYYIILVVDNKKQIAESNESDNIVMFKIIIS